MTSKTENSKTPPGTVSWSELLGYPPMTPEEAERQRLGAERLKEAFSSIPWHARRAEKDPDYWNDFYTSRINW